MCQMGFSSCLALLWTGDILKKWLMQSVAFHSKIYFLPTNTPGICPLFARKINKEASWLYAELFLCWFSRDFWTPHVVRLSTLGTTWCPYGNHCNDMEQQGDNNICSFQANLRPQSRQAMETTGFLHDTNIIYIHGNDVEMTLFSSCGASPWKGHHFYP